MVPLHRRSASDHAVRGRPLLLSGKASPRRRGDHECRRGTSRTMTTEDPICLEDVNVRDLRTGDLDDYISYWHDPHNTALDILGIDRSKVYPAKKMREMLTLTI